MVDLDTTLTRTVDRTYNIALEEAASIADGMATENEARAIDLHKRSNKQAAAGFDDRAEQTKISAQVLDECANEARAIAAAIRARIQKAEG